MRGWPLKVPDPLCQTGQISTYKSQHLTKMQAWFCRHLHSVEHLLCNWDDWRTNTWLKIRTIFPSLNKETQFTKRFWSWCLGWNVEKAAVVDGLNGNFVVRITSAMNRSFFKYNKLLIDRTLDRKDKYKDNNLIKLWDITGDLLNKMANVQLYISSLLRTLIDNVANNSINTRIRKK